jgi:hypothetical protein
MSWQEINDTRLAHSRLSGECQLKKSAHAAEQQRDDVKAAREAWFEGQLDLGPARLIFM